MKIDNPYIHAKQQWDRKLGRASVQLRLLCFCTLFLVLICGALSFGVIRLLEKPRELPYIVEVTNDGSVEYKGPIDKQDFTITETHIRHHLFKFLEYVRTLSSDIVVVKRNWRNAYYYVTSSGAEILNTYARDIDPLSRYKTVRVDMRIISVLEHSQKTRQINWIETTWSSDGKIIEEAEWRGIFKFEIHGLRESKQVQYNPLGFFVDAFNWSKVEL